MSIKKKSRTPTLVSIPDVSESGQSSFQYGNARQEQRYTRNLAGRSPVFYLTVFSLWAITVMWFHPRLVSLLDVAGDFLSSASILYFVLFTEIAWLYGIYNISVVCFSMYLQRRQKTQPQPMTVDAVTSSDTPVAVLYTTCNDFVRESAISCLSMDYPNFTLYILDDSSDPDCQRQVDQFASLNKGRVQVVRRPQRQGFKAGNLNYALQHVVDEPLFVIADADEIMPEDFLGKLVPRIEADPHCGFIQANHASKPWADTRLEKDMGIGVDIHWKWYQPIRNHYGFVMFLGHGAILKTECWSIAGGFPEMVSEDLAYALAIRERGYYGTFAEDVVCYEEFPSSVRAFRIRHVKWTRGTCEFLANKLLPMVRSPYISWIEKLDILFPTLNLPLTFFFFLFMLNAGIFIPLAFGEEKILTLVVLGQEVLIPLLLLPEVFTRLFTPDFFLITVVTILGPVLCFILELWRKPLRLFRFLAHSTALYAALSPISTLCVFAYLATGKARFLVTGDSSISIDKDSRQATWMQRSWKFLCETHPDHSGVWLFEVCCALLFIYAALTGFQVSFLGIAIAFMLLPLMHYLSWDHMLSRTLRYAPFSLVITGLALGGFSIFGIQPVLFGFGFHF